MDRKADVWNYRISLANDDARLMAESDELNGLLEADQVCVYHQSVVPADIYSSRTQWLKAKLSRATRKAQ